MNLRAAILMLALGLSACASLLQSTGLPRFALAPAALGRELAVQQQLRFVIGPVTRRVDAYLEIDAESLRLATLAGGQVGLGIEWDGKELRARRAEWMPESVDPAQVLSDVQLALWPITALRAALPAECTLEESPPLRPLARKLVCGEDRVISVHYSTPYSASGALPRLIVLEHPGYRLELESAASL